MSDEVDVVDADSPDDTPYVASETDVPAGYVPGGSVGSQKIDGDDVVTFDAEGNEVGRVPRATGGAVAAEEVEVVEDDG